MPAAPDNITYINIRDFRPGISDDPGADYPPGAAQRAGTWRCIANQGGALVPLPRRTIPFSMPVDTATPVDGHYGCVGLYAPSMGVLPSTVVDYPHDMVPTHQLFVANEYLDGTNHHVRVRRVRRFQEPRTGMDEIKHLSFADAGTTYQATGGLAWGTTRSNRANPTLPNVDPNLPNIINPGIPVTIFGWTAGFAQAFLSEFPDDQNPTSGTPYDIFLNNFILGMCTHQGRVVVQYATSDQQGPGAFMFTGENYRWSAVNDVTPANWSQIQVFVPESPSGAVMCSMTANELFLLKGQGAAMISGSLNTPTVITLPMVVGTRTPHVPVATQIGVVYGNLSSGVWLWPHGDTSQLLSPNLAPNFWTDETTWGGLQCQFDRCDEWVLVPNNWLYDIDLKSWWRVEDPAVASIRYWTVHERFIYGAQSYYTNAAPTPVHFWRRDDWPAETYSWQSHPLWETVNELVDLREIVLRVQGVGSITVTMTGETSTSSVTFPGINTGPPMMLRQPCRIQDSNIAIKIESTGAPGYLGSIVAPTVLELNCGYVTTQREGIR